MSHVDQAVAVRKAMKADLPAIKALQDDNLVQKLSEQERRQYGFLSFGFSMEELDRLSSELGIMAAFAGQELAGYFVAKTLGRACDYRLLKGIIQAMPRWSFGKQPLTEYKCCFLGPICVARSFRGKNIPAQLVSSIKGELARSYEVGITFVAKENTRSHKLLTQKLQFVDVGQHEDTPKQFNIVVLDLRNGPGT